MSENEPGASNAQFAKPSHDIETSGFLPIGDYFCPICTARLNPNPRYPRYVCGDCAAKATDIARRKLQFYNAGLGGGYIAQYVDTQETYHSHICYIDGIRCHADEARFGGIVIEVAEEG